MVLKRLLVVPFTVLTAVSLVVFLPGGCPQQQIPQQPPADEEPADPIPPGVRPPGEEERPIPPPDIDDGGELPGDGDGIDIPGDGPPSTGNAYLGFVRPFGPITVRPGTVVNLVFNLALDLGATVADASFILARDDDGDRVPDGDPVYEQAVTVEEGENKIAFDTSDADPLLSAQQLGRFLMGMKVRTTAGKTALGYASGTVTIDGQAPTALWVSPKQDLLLTREGNIEVSLITTDNSTHTVRIVLDPDLTPNSGNEVAFVREDVSPGEHTFSVPLGLVPAGTVFYYYVTVTDGLGEPFAFYAPKTGGGYARLLTTNRLVGDFLLEQLMQAMPPGQQHKSKGAVLQGFNYNDLAGSSMVTVPDLDGDGASELLIGSRFGKPRLVNTKGIGWGEAYLIYGQSQSSRLTGAKELNAVTATTPGGIPGVVFAGIRTPIWDPSQPAWTEGLADIAVINDMDGDGRPELVFNFPRVESLTLNAPAWVGGIPFQHPDLVHDIPGMGTMEYDAIDYVNVGWFHSKAQFTRGGVVIVSSQNQVLTNRTQLTRKSDRVLNLHEIGQMFNFMVRPSLARYLRRIDDVTPLGPPDDPNDYAWPRCEDCIPYDPEDYEPIDPQHPNCVDEPDPKCANPLCPCRCKETGPHSESSSCSACDPDDPEKERAYRSTEVVWDVWLGGGSPNCWQGPGGFHMPWTVPPADPPLTNPSFFTTTLPNPSYIHPCNGPCLTNYCCEITHRWYLWTEEYMCFEGIPEIHLDYACKGSWIVVPGMPPISAWTGFLGNVGNGQPRYYAVGGEVLPPTSVGARILGQAVDDRFAFAATSDGRFLYISAPEHTALKEDVPTLPADREKSGVVYQLRTDVRTSPGAPNAAQLWVEPGANWPYIDAQIPNRVDYTMPVPHQYIIESVGSTRGAWGFSTYSPVDPNGCYGSPDPVEVATATEAYGYRPYPVFTAGYYTDRTPQIVGPHANAQLSYVRALGDVDGDGLPDIGVGSDKIKDPVTNQVVGAIYVISSRSIGGEGDYLLENLQLAPNDPKRLRGFMLKGSAAGDKLARVFDNAGDFNGDGFADVIVGNYAANNSTGEAVLILGSQNLESPQNGWTIDDVVSSGRAVRFTGVLSGDRLGENIAGVGDVDGDGYDDILIAAPGAELARGVVYLIYGGPHLSGTINIGMVGTVDLPGARLIGRAVGDRAGGGSKAFTYQLPGFPIPPPPTNFTVYSRGVAALGDIDGDGRDDYAISAMLANPNNRQDAGEVYILYGRGD